MPRAQEQLHSASEDSDSDGSGSSYSDRSGDSSEDDSNSEGISGDEEEGEDAEAKKQRVRADIDEMRLMMADMDTIKARLQQRLASERQARAEETARKDREREAKDAVRRKFEEEARGRQVEAGVQTEPQDLQQQLNVSHQPPYRSHGEEAVGDAAVIADASALPAVDGGAGFTDAIPNKPRPAGLSLYDLVKTSAFDLSRKMHSPVHQADQQEELPTHLSKEIERESPTHERQDTPMIERRWSRDESHFEQDQGSVVTNNGQDSVVDSGNGSESGYITSPNASRLNSVRQTKHQQFPHHFDENSASVSNSLVSSIADNQSAVFPNPIQGQDHKFNAAALLSTGKRPPPPMTKEEDSAKTDEQREMEAIQCLLFGR
ncbi:hypothetical protein DVH05_024994 [Phytophthora capsici]|nr:hypothetical protein DVH05_024994 [Phytophthora capsici]